MLEDIIKRREPTVEVGLTAMEVDERNKAKLVNKQFSYRKMSKVSFILGNFINIHIVLALVFLVLIILSNQWIGLLYLIPVLVEIILKVVLIVISKEHKAKEQTNYVVVRDGIKENIKKEAIVLDDIVLLKENELIPVDGIIKSGQIVVDESLLFGFQSPQIKKEGDQVYAGSSVISGNASIKCEKLEKETLKHEDLICYKKTKARKLNILLLVLSIMITLLMVFSFATYGIRHGLEWTNLKTIVLTLLTISSFGLFCYITLSLFVGFLRIKKHGVRVHNFCSLDTFQSIDTVCFDKTGVLAGNGYEVKKVLLFGSDYTSDDVDQIISNLLQANKEPNILSSTLKKHFKYKLSKRVIRTLPYKTENNYFGATFAGGETYAIGFPIYLNIKNKIAVRHRTEEYLKQGCDVLVLARCEDEIDNDRIPGEMNPVAFIVLQKCVSENTINFVKYLNEHNIGIKVISGDEPSIVNQVAIESGIETSNNIISLKNMTDEEVCKAALEYSVFGYATAKQKELIIKTLQKHKHKVAMIGDGLNDVLAFGASDVSICMGSGKQTVKSYADIVLENDDLESLEETIIKGKQTIYNAQRILSLFVVRSFLAVFLSTFGLLGISFPFMTFVMFGFVITGLGALFLCFDSVKKPVFRGLIKDLLRKTIPAILVIVLSITIYFILTALESNSLFYTGVYSYDNYLAAVTLGTMTVSLVGIAILFKCYTRFELYSLISFLTTVLIFVLLVIWLVVINILNARLSGNFGVPFLDVNLNSLTLVNYFVFGLVIIIITSVYLLISYIIEIIKGEHIHAENKSRSSKSH